MVMTPEERQRVIDLLDQMDVQKRERTLSTNDSFERWLKNTFNEIYNKIKDFLQSLWDSIRSFF